MATILQQYNTSTVVPSFTALATLASVTGATSGAVDNTSTKFLALDLELVAGITTATSTVDFYLVGSEDGTNFATVSDTEKANVQFIGSISCVSGTPQTKVVRIEQIPRQWKIYAYNANGTALSSGTVYYSGIALTNA